LVKFKTWATKSIVENWGTTTADHHADAQYVKFLQVHSLSEALTIVVVIVCGAPEVYNG